MHADELMQVALYLLALTALSIPLGAHMAAVLEGRRHLLSKPLGWLERALVKAGGFDPAEDMGAGRYARSVLAFSGLSLAVLMALQMLQHKLPLNPSGLPGASWHLAFNTAVSFVTNTNWQSYAGEVTYGRLVQMLGLGVQNFVSAAAGIAVLAALVRGLRRSAPGGVGSFWADLVRSTVHILLPLSLALALALVWQGVPQTFAPDAKVATLQGAGQVLPLGPVASQVAIKQLGTNGGGYYNANSAVPYENPTPLSNFLESLSILIVSSALCWTFGLMLGRPREGLALWGAMTAFFVVVMAAMLWAETRPNPALGPGANLEGKETRFGVANSILWENATTAASNGSVNSMHASSQPLSGGLALFNMLVGEVIYGGVGSGLYGMVVYAVLAVFLAGLMVGRSPEYLGKAVGRREVALVMAALLLPNAAVLLGAGLFAVLPQGLSSLTHTGPHGLGEILYNFASASNNNGSAFACTNANTPWWNVALGLCMLVGRFGPLLAVLGLAGSFAGRKPVPASAGSFATDTPLFAALLVAVILIVGVLTFLPALSLGPIVEHLALGRGLTF